MSSDSLYYIRQWQAKLVSSLCVLVKMRRILLARLICEPVNMKQHEISDN
jgi:hypothetical protein